MNEFFVISDIEECPRARSIFTVFTKEFENGRLRDFIMPIYEKESERILLQYYNKQKADADEITGWTNTGVFVQTNSKMESTISR